MQDRPSLAGSHQAQGCGRDTCQDGLAGLQSSSVLQTPRTGTVQPHYELLRRRRAAAFSAAAWSSFSAR